MFLYFIGALLISTAIFKLGAYWTVISLMANVGKILAGFLLVSTLVLLYRKLVISRSTKLKVLPRQK